MNCTYCKNNLIGHHTANKVFYCGNCSCQFFLMAGNLLVLTQIFFVESDNKYNFSIVHHENKFQVMKMKPNYDYAEILSLDYIPEKISPTTAPQMFRRLMNLKAFS